MLTGSLPDNRAIMVVETEVVSELFSVACTGLEGFIMAVRRRAAIMVPDEVPVGSTSQRRKK